MKDVVIMSMDGASARIVIKNKTCSAVFTSPGLFAFATESVTLGMFWAQRYEKTPITRIDSDSIARRAGVKKGGGDNVITGGTRDAVIAGDALQSIGL
jgi:hypothetical protein